MKRLNLKGHLCQPPLVSTVLFTVLFQMYVCISYFFIFDSPFGSRVDAAGVGAICAMLVPLAVFSLLYWKRWRAKQDLRNTLAERNKPADLEMVAELLKLLIDEIESDCREARSIRKLTQTILRELRRCEVHLQSIGSAPALVSQVKHIKKYILRNINFPLWDLTEERTGLKGIVSALFFMRPSDRLLAQQMFGHIGRVISMLKSAIVMMQSQVLDAAAKDGADGIPRLHSVKK